jgi:hypothetical protein
MPTRTRERIIRNRAQCRLCGDVVESKHRWDFVWCQCGEIAVDGGDAYIKRTAKNFDNLIELSETEEETYESQW